MGGIQQKLVTLITTITIRLEARNSNRFISTVRKKNQFESMKTEHLSHHRTEAEQTNG